MLCVFRGLAGPRRIPHPAAAAAADRLECQAAGLRALITISSSGSNKSSSNSSSNSWSSSSNSIAAAFCGGCRSWFSSVAGAELVSSNRAAAAGSSAAAAAGSSAAAAAGASGLSPAAAAALGTIRSSFEQSLRRSISLQQHASNASIVCKTLPSKRGPSEALGATTAAAGGRAAAAAARKGGAQQMSRRERRAFQGHLRRYQLFGTKPEFHNVDRNKNERIFEPTDSFLLRVTTTKNNVHCALLNKANSRRTIFASFAGNVGFRKSQQQSSACAYRVGENVARKMRRLGLQTTEVLFRRIARVEAVLKALHAHGIVVSRLTHEPRLPTCGLNARKPRKRRRV
ncbi:hypothetical protein Esti_006802 [Eimeria stiedai]